MIYYKYYWCVHVHGNPSDTNIFPVYSNNNFVENWLTNYIKFYEGINSL